MKKKKHELRHDEVGLKVVAIVGGKIDRTNVDYVGVNRFDPLLMINGLGIE